MYALKDIGSFSTKYAVSKKPEQTFAIKISTKNNKDIGQVEKLLKTNIRPSKLNVPIAKVKKIKTGEVIVECINKKDVEKLKTVVDTSKELKSKEIIKGSPRVILNKIDKNLDKTKLIEVICKNNKDFIEACGGIDDFKRQDKKKFRLGGRDTDKYVSVVLDVTSEARKELLKRRIVLEWECVYAKDYISLIQCYKCYRFGHKLDTCTCQYSDLMSIEEKAQEALLQVWLFRQETFTHDDR
ncbi:hypothetical protein ILUMI_00153 [Ignelater luminosus]|uniref:CCHC-type domain-containing protein n=1 Tax=Ignelater luminosus TaxID=2038154 RepID=A0A8K0DME4_IGNLU|nr:hypothetical protein ILUMI_00153 [Ignelater luminosus]